MRTSPPHAAVAGTGLSAVWASCFLAAANAHDHELAPLVVQVQDDLGATEDTELRARLDVALASSGNSSVESVATTIFPQRKWIAAQGNRDAFFGGYLRVYPRIKAMDSRNRKGTYFGRLIEPLANVPEGQLEHLIRLYQGNPSVVKMKLQAGIFRSDQDHESGARPGFPCLQQISLAPYGSSLSLNCFYASQQLLLKGYGNYLGLIRLGRFLAGEMGLTFSALNVLVGMAKLDHGGISRDHFDSLQQRAQEVLS